MRGGIAEEMEMDIDDIGKAMSHMMGKGKSRVPIAVMSKGNSMERAHMMRSLGAEVVLVDQQPGSVVGEVSGADLQLVFEETERLCKSRGAFRADQFQLEGNVRAHVGVTNSL